MEYIIISLIISLGFSGIVGGFFRGSNLAIEILKTIIVSLILGFTVAKIIL